MHKIIRAVLLVLCLCGVTTIAQAAQCKVRGTDIASGKPYEGRVSTNVIGKIIKVEWDMPGGVHYSGSGIIDGDAVAIYFKPGYNAVALYRIERGTGVFHGTWTALSSDDIAIEDWIPLK
ncbi:MAG: hypothetical protein ABI439_10385 [Rhodospirillales bacterium]